jgi:glycosyltransferase involved in cell wall biosynthesis
MDERIVLTAAAKVVIAHSAYARARISSAIGRRVERVDYGVDVTTFGPDAPAPSSVEVARLLTTPEVPRVLYLSPPTLGRGAGYVLDLLVAIQARVPEVEIVVAGQDPESPEWQEGFMGEARELGLLDRMQLIPQLPAGDIPALHRACSVAMAPLIALESGGLAILEAMASGLPVVASPLGAVQDLIDDGEDGLLVPATEIPRFADALHRLLLDPAARESLGQSARSRVAERHGIERSMNRLEAIYGDLADSRRRAA